MEVFRWESVGRRDEAQIDPDRAFISRLGVYPIKTDKTASKILLLNEPYVKGFNRTQRWAGRTRGRVLRVPDWLAYATAVLERAGIGAKLYDFPAEGGDKHDLRRLVRNENPDFVVLDSTTPSIFSDIECARICKEESRGEGNHGRPPRLGTSRKKRWISRTGWLM